MAVRVDPNRDTRWNTNGNIENDKDDSILTINNESVYAGGRRVLPAELRTKGINISEIRALGEKINSGAELNTAEMQFLGDAAVRLGSTRGK